MKSKFLKKLTFFLLFFLLCMSVGSKESFAAKWWNKFGKPQYGGTINFAVTGIMAVNFDNYVFVGADSNYFYEAMFEPDWTLDRKICSMNGNFVPDQYWKGQLAETWEIPDAQTIVVHLHKGIRWQNKPPVNGREFTAYDVEAHYDRILGTGHGYTWPSAIYMGSAGNMKKVTAKDKYTVIYKFKKPSALNFQTIADRWALNCIEAPEYVALDGPPKPPPPQKGPAGPPPPGPPPMPDFGNVPTQDQKNAVGTGAWILEKYVGNTSFTFIKNPDYWGTDPRYPKNKLPYADKVVMIVIPDYSTRVAAIRTRKIDLMGTDPSGALDWKKLKIIKKTNPELLSFGSPAGANGVAMRADKAPFTDIRVRKALNMAIDRKAIAKSIYGGTVEGNPTGMITQEFKGWAFDYKDWPKSLKGEYAYNPKGAKKLLAEAGYPNGFKTNVVMPSNDAGLEIIQVFKSYFKNIGVDMEIRTMDPIGAQAFMRAGKHDQMVATGAASPFPPNRGMDLFYSKGGTDAIYYGLVDKPDTVYDKLRSDFINATDPAKAAKIYQKMDRRIIEQHYIVAPCEYYGYKVSQPYLKGYSGEIIMWGGGVTFSRIWVDQNLKKKMKR